MTVHRRAARVLLVDAAGCVLLFLGHDPARPGAGTWWFTAGGGLDEGESSRAAAVRELREETGLVVAEDDLVGPVHRETAEFSLAGSDYRQDNEFFLLTVGAHEVETGGFSDLERSFVLQHRWWDRPHLRATSDTVYPVGLPDLLDRLGV